MHSHSIKNKPSNNSLNCKPSNSTEGQINPSGNEVSNRTEQVEYELEDPEFEMSDVDESVVNSSFGGANNGEDSIANKPGGSQSKNKNLNIF